MLRGLEGEATDKRPRPKPKFSAGVLALEQASEQTSICNSKSANFAVRQPTISNVNLTTTTMSIPPTKKRKLGAASAGAKLTQTIAIKASAKPSLSKSHSSKRDKDARQTSNDDSGASDEEFSDVSEDDDNDDDDTSSINNDGDISSGNASDDSDDSLASDSDSLPASTKKRKRTDPSAFATSMSKILSSHLTATARKDPVLVRAKHAAAHIDDSKLEARARRLLTAEKRAALDRGRVRDVVPRDDATGEEVKNVLEREKALRKIAQRGVIKLFNAVRAAQVKGEEAARENKVKGTLGMDTRSKNVTEISKESFLDMISKSQDK
ncbi:hypothetical protein Dda_8521 [Drechslerella dactyloides]|uniref:Rrp15p-domain-containing protein n=1 Tax=Drechslerella dactyloides TaxID=74499 RepID=A0AAD6IQS7_DREDA|nr:hypothetical protein Dda_8521 [Drechslerella dactyloides]